MKIIIIEDEPRTAKELQRMLEHLDNAIQVEVILPSVAASIKWLKSNPPPELIFSDIQLGDGLSFEIFREVKVETPIIFCTAFDEYAIRAFESNSIDYLLKPIEEDVLAKSLEKFSRFKDHLIGNATYAQSLTKVLNQMDPNYKQNILVHYRDKILPVKVSEIGFVYATGGAAHLYLAAEKSYPVQFGIDQLEAMLNPIQFFRVNRQFIVNRDAIENIERYFNRKLCVITTIQAPEKIIVGKLKAQLFLKWMEQ